MFTGTVLDREGGTESKDHLSAFGFRFLCVSLALSLSLCLSVSPLFFSPLISFIYYHLFFILFVFLLSILPVSSLSSHLFFVFFSSFPPSLSIFPLNLPPYSRSLSPLLLTSLTFFRHNRIRQPTKEGPQRDIPAAAAGHRGPPRYYSQEGDTAVHLPHRPPLPTSSFGQDHRNHFTDHWFSFTQTQRTTPFGKYFCYFSFHNDLFMPRV